nr:hypothetical protein [Lachnospiraceae bacterium]
QGYTNDSYCVISTYDVIYKGNSTPAASLNSCVVDTQKDGSLYIKKADLPEEEQMYYVNITMEDDVQELIDQTNKDYDAQCENDPSLERLLNDINAEVESSVKRRLAEE